MGLPSKKRTSQSKHDRASHFALKHRSLGACAKCGKAILSHRACPHCGTYKGKLVLKVKTKKPARAKK
ncbi:MAG: 50S ribosomal protein L32 [Candidatus Komeilibacteria bacterium]|nr:50S ribosomal protein L32 [Candidatus Komeilibacteria bacterium]